MRWARLRLAGPDVALYATVGLFVGVGLLYLFWRLFMVDVGALRTLLPPSEVR